jgi:hypothetical protein
MSPVAVWSVENLREGKTMTSLAQRSSSFFETSTDQVLGVTQPRVFTPPLREDLFTNPQASYGHGVIAFARDVLAEPLDPWEEEATIRGGELLPDGRPRFRKLLIIVARQNGKTFLLRVLALYWLFVECWSMVYGMSNNLANAARAWNAAIDTAQENELLGSDIKRINRATSKESFLTTFKSEYCFGAPNKNAARSFSVDRLIADELRMHTNWEVWGASINSMNAKPFGQLVAITNQGDDTGIVLDSLIKEAHAFIKTGEGDHRLGILEWSAPAGSSPVDPAALAYANPNLGRRIDLDSLVSEGKRCLRAGGEELDKFLTEVMCIRIRAFDGAINPEAWKASYVAGDLRTLKNRLAFFIDATPGPSGHIALIGAAYLEDGRIRVETIRTWNGPTASTTMRERLPDVLRRSGARKLGWMPGMEMAKYGPDLRGMRIGGVVIEEIKTEVSDVCMQFAEQVESGHIVYGDDEVELTDQVVGAFKNFKGEKWNFSRKGKGDCNMAYAAAGAVYLARTMPRPLGPTRGFAVVENG